MTDGRGPILPCCARSGKKLAENRKTVQENRPAVSKENNTGERKSIQRGAKPMKTTITAIGMAVTPGITKRIDRKTATMSRYLRQDTEVFVKLRKERNQKICEITVPMGGNVTLRAESASDDNLFMAIDSALAKLERQILRHRTRLDKRLREDVDLSETEFIEDHTVYGEGEKEIVRHKTYPVRPMSPEDAALQMELLGHGFFVFVNQDTDQVNVLYARKDGNLGILEPEE